MPYNPQPLDVFHHDLTPQPTGPLTFEIGLFMGLLMGLLIGACVSSEKRSPRGDEKLMKKMGTKNLQLSF